MERTREEHMIWCKMRALEYVDRGDCHNAVVSMGSDLGKHEETSTPATPGLIMIGMMEISKGTEAVRRWINGFN